MDNFYRKILNLRNTNKNIENEIDNILKEYFSKYPSDSEGMCFIHTTNLKELLLEKEIKTYQINSQNLGASYEHYFLIVDNIEEIYLIDPTYSQFDSKGKTLINNKLKLFPSDTLLKTDKGQNLYKKLITKKYSKVDIEDIILYLESLETHKINNIDDLIIAASIKR